jgi:hypothetical protein
MRQPLTAARVRHIARSIVAHQDWTPDTIPWAAQYGPTMGWNRTWQRTVLHEVARLRRQQPKEAT